MKKSILTIMALALACTGCMKESITQEEINWTLTVRAEKDSSPDTKGIEIGDGKDEASTTSLKSIWKDGEEALVYLGTKYIGKLTATPDNADPHLATLTGTVTSSGITAGSTTLTLLTPLSTWAYTGQDGSLNTIGSNFHYTLAENAPVTSVSGNSINIGHVRFKNQQGIYRLNFRFQKDGVGDKLPITTRQAWFSAADAGLVRSCSIGEAINTGSIDLKLETPTTDPFFAALRFKETSKDEALNFKVLGDDGVTYYGSKTVPAAYKPNGNFVSIKNTVLTERLELNLSSTKVSTAL